MKKSLTTLYGSDFQNFLQTPENFGRNAKSGSPFFGKIPKHGYFFFEKLPLTMGMGPERQIPNQSKSETPQAPSLDLVW